MRDGRPASRLHHGTHSARPDLAVRGGNRRIAARRRVCRGAIELALLVLGDRCVTGGHGSPHLDKVARAILAYLTRNPHAVDTDEGIRDSWLRQEQIEEGSAAVTAALEQLVEAGALRRWRGPDGRQYFELRAASA